MSSFRYGLGWLDALAAHSEPGKLAAGLNRLLGAGLILFALTLPHSIAAAQISLGLSYLAWLARALVTGKLHVVRTPLERPLLWFMALTAASALFSFEPGESLPKLRSLTLFAMFYLVLANLHPRGVRWLAGLLIVSGLAGVGYSFAEKALGRGLVITSIAEDSPLRASPLQPGDVIWMIGRARIHALADAPPLLNRIPAGQSVDIEAIHEGDPLPVTLTVTDELKRRANPLGLSVAGRSRRFRISGFGRHFITYAELMQLFALLAFGLLFAQLRAPRAGGRWRGWGYLALAGVFALALVLTASRSVIAACVLALLVVVAAFVKERRATWVALAAAAVIVLLAVYVLGLTRPANATSFADDSSQRRWGYMRAGLRLIPQHPLLGVGLDAQKRHWQEWGFPGDYVTHTHSTPIQIAVDRGLPALGCYVWLLWMLFVLTWRAYQQALRAGDTAGAGLALGALGGLAGFCASSLVNYNFGDSEVLLLLLLIVALALVKNRPDDLVRYGER